MRMPSFSELDVDQRGIYTESPSTGAVLVTGPPGTGKTVVAFHRGLRLSGSGEPVTLIMFNKVLSKYTSSVGVKHGISIIHMHAWVSQWIKPLFPRTPTLGKPYLIDWVTIREAIEATTDQHIIDRLNWGNLIIDEGQDFQIEMYECLMEVVNHPLNEEKKPTLTVFADENQTITQSNSTIDQLTQVLSARVRNRRLWRLSKNYRNTQEIAEFSTHYQLTGRSAAITPEEKGPKPQCLFLDSQLAVARHIVNYVVNNGLVNVGVCSFGTKKNLTEIYHEIKKIRTSENAIFKIQMYISGNPKQSEHADVKRLEFDNPPSVTLLHSKSSKGLEFDTVFVVNLHADSRVFDQHAQELIKDMYVISSRARKILFYDIVCLEDNLPQSVRIMPSPEVGLCKYQALTPWSENMQDYLANVPWAETQEMADRLRARGIVKEVSAGGDVAVAKIKELIDSNPRNAVIATVVEDFLITKNENSLVNIIMELGVQRVEGKLSELSF